MHAYVHTRTYIHIWTGFGLSPSVRWNRISLTAWQEKFHGNEAKFSPYSALQQYGLCQLA